METISEYKKGVNFGAQVCTHKEGVKPYLKILATKSQEFLIGVTDGMDLVRKALEKQAMEKRIARGY